MSNYYILEGKKPKPVEMIEWARWFGKADRIVKSEMIEGVHISTVFLGLDHGFGGNKSLYFETMIFGGEHDEYQERYSTWEEAEAGHAAAVKLVNESLKIPS